MPSAIIKLKIILKIWKIHFWPTSQGSEKWQKPIISRKMKIIILGCLIAQMKRFDALITNAINPSALRSPVLEKIRKNGLIWPFFKNDLFCAFSWFFKKWDLAESWGFLRCNQCIKTLHLSYQTHPYNDFHFWTYNGFLEIFRPPVGGVKNLFWKFLKWFLFLVGQKASKTTSPGQSLE